MTRDEVINALHVCSDPAVTTCRDCPYSVLAVEVSCISEMARDALSLIEGGETDGNGSEG